ncbi:Glyoxalase/bleomycin resistance protein/dioxygenase [Candidatus Koribacter versatilis Ellin345]|uniref:Glyoxalase/bleomycin resistance protein/dioxygenase n=2 Tax=Candidatus Korobacter versatilis TaxID=658062 RepID=Q1IL14_KORVE|nr:Glyoxalase/bleomycin resistance protein/dioxygenase [Candidatus Koribacter versatilis Ellin345]
MSEYRKTSLAPMLSVRQGKQALEFYKEALAAQVVECLENDGSVVARLSIQGAEFWIADESPDHKNFSPESLGGATTRMVLTVSDPDAFFDRAVAAGGKAIEPVKDQEYGWRLGRVMDPYGHHWEIGRPLT